jgi:hypothetical protein
MRFGLRRNGSDNGDVQRLPALTSQPTKAGYVGRLKLHRGERK